MLTNSECGLVVCLLVKALQIADGTLLFHTSWLLIFGNWKHEYDWFISGTGKMNLNNVKVPKMPGGGAASALIKFGIVAGLGVYGVANSLYNVEGGHRAIVFNRIGGVKNKVFYTFGSFGP